MKTKSESTSEATTQLMPDPKLVDHRQSHPEDVDITALEAEIVYRENHKMCEISNNNIGGSCHGYLGHIQHNKANVSLSPSNV